MCGREGRGLFLPLWVCFQDPDVVLFVIPSQEGTLLFSDGGVLRTACGGRGPQVKCFCVSGFLLIFPRLNALPCPGPNQVLAHTPLVLCYGWTGLVLASDHAGIA